jgi:DNA-binding transcriptional regulator PaaX
MGIQENTHKKRARKQQVKNSILAAVAVGGVVATAAVVPGLFVAFGQLQKMGLLPDMLKEESVKRAFMRMRKQNLIGVKNGRYVLTSKGELLLAQEGFLRAIQPVPRRWDGKWRVLIFDLPKTRNRERRQLREILHANGFVLLQKSVWVYPYPCDDFVAMIKTKLKIRPFVLYMIVDSIENQEHLEHEFGVSC